MLDKIKSWLGVAATVAIGVLLFVLRGQKKRTEEAESQLAKAVFKNQTQENDKEYEDAKANADRLVTDYQSSKRSDIIE